MIGASWNDKNVPREEDHRRDLTFIGQKKSMSSRHAFNHLFGARLVAVKLINPGYWLNLFYH